MIRRRQTRGFGLVEIMVGMVISMLATIVVFQVFATAERQKRGTTGAADAQVNGAIALSMLERDIKTAGWGLEGEIFSECERTYSYVNDGASAAGPIPNLLAAAIITDGGAGPDQIALRYFDNPTNANYNFGLTSLLADNAAGIESVRVKSLYACRPRKVGDPKNFMALVQGSGNCTLMQITDYDEATLTAQVKSGVLTPNYNPDSAYKAANNWPTYKKNNYFQCFPMLSSRTYRVNNGQLEMLEPDAAGLTQTLQVAPDILDIQAQYGVTEACAAKPCPQKITEWVDAKGSWSGTLSNSDRRRIKALRIAIVARSAEYEKPDSSGTCATTTAEMAGGWSSWAKFDTSGYPNLWQCYRYKVFETVAPLRNIMWDNI